MNRETWSSSEDEMESRSMEIQYVQREAGESVKETESGSCAGLGWDRMDPLPRSLYHAMVWICDENSADSTPLF